MSEGRIFKQGRQVVVEMTGRTELLKIPGVDCLNPEDGESARVYRRNFKRKRIYLPHEYDRAMAEMLHGEDVVVLGMNGYSSLSEERCRRWQIKPGAYEAACEAILDKVITQLAADFSGIDIRIVHGASNMGVDGASIKTALRRNRPQLGFSCPHFMFYVVDDNLPVYVAESQEEYSKAFARSLDILIAANGSNQSFKHDMAAALHYQKDLIPIDVIGAISRSGGISAVDSAGNVEDAVAAMYQFVHSIQYNGFGRFGWERMLKRLTATTRKIARRIISPERAFGVRS